jgi:hypothetical protein
VKKQLSMMILKLIATRTLRLPAVADTLDCPMPPFIVENNP